jgi:hypothetical protein
MEGLGRECIGDTEDLELARGIEIEPQVTQPEFRGYRALRYMLRRPLGLKDFTRTIVRFARQERLGFLPPECTDFIELDCDKPLLPVLELHVKGSGHRVQFGVFSVGCAEAWIERFDVWHSLLSRPNVGVQPPPKAVGWNNGLDRSLANSFDKTSA